MVSSSLSICFDVCLSLCSESRFFEIESVSFIGILTYRSLMSTVINLRFSSIFSVVRSLASVVVPLTL
jgi:hypothetical protein